MIKTIQIENQSIEINSSAGWLYEYRARFGHDILSDLMPVIEAVLTAAAELFNGKSEVTQERLAEAFGDDSMIDAFIKLAGLEVVTVYNILWSMAKNANPSISEPREFFNGFEVMPMDIILPEIFEAIVKSSISSKNATRLLQIKSKMRKA